ncbi:alpha/beta fold hydrolase [Streptomyces sp. NPDC056669]|uniref:alpha/beta fold hydrolase n=1 Tax=Streptomyces sp. NPDC056669 TaxID=3345903 RepID=UPI0036B9A2FF
MSTGDRLVPGLAQEDGGPAVESARGDKDSPVVVTRRAPGEPGRGRALLLHGLSNSSTVWDACVEHGRQAGGPEIWAADLPWRGRSIAGWSARGDLVPYLGDALRAVPGGAGVVVAHSMGANVLMEFLGRRIEEGLDPFAEFGIHGMVLVAPFYRRTAEEFDWASLAYSVDTMAPLIAEGIRVHAGDRVPGATRHQLAERIRDWVGPYGWMRFFEIYLRTPALRLGRFTVPCLVLSGADDFAAPPAEGRALADGLPDAEYRLLPDCGHFLMIERARQFAALLDRFVSTTCSAVRPHGGPGLGFPWEHDR